MRKTIASLLAAAVLIGGSVTLFALRPESHDVLTAPASAAPSVSTDPEYVMLMGGGPGGDPEPLAFVVLIRCSAQPTSWKDAKVMCHADSARVVLVDLATYEHYGQGYRWEGPYVAPSGEPAPSDG